MQRRPLGGGRTLAALGAVVVLAGAVLPWWRLGRPGELPPLSGNAFEGSGILVFLVAVATLALVALPYAMGDRPTAIDRWISYAMLAVVGWIGLLFRVVQLTLEGAFRFDEPAQVFTNGPGLWVAGIGLGILARAVYRMTREPAYR
ncbi:MAG: hypothetical protein H0U37_05055 [Chloroflexi bacterium]|nr:hypothetical protein [Chloroflexota bacterium]